MLSPLPAAPSLFTSPSAGSRGFGAQMGSAARDSMSSLGSTPESAGPPRIGHSPPVTPGHLPLTQAPELRRILEGRLPRTPRTSHWHPGSQDLLQISPNTPDPLWSPPVPQQPPAPLTSPPIPPAA